MTNAQQVELAKKRLDEINARIQELEPWSFVTASQLVQLMSDLDSNRVSNRKQGNTTLSYVEAHDIKNMLIRIFGFGMASSDVIREVVTPGEWFQNEKYNKQNVRVLATVTVQVTIQPPARPVKVAFNPVTFTETATSSQTGADEGDTADFAVKTAASDAFKRAMIFLGTQFGLSLYANGATGDQVRAIFEPTQSELLALGRERDRIHAFLAQARQAARSGAPNPGVATGTEPAPAAAQRGNAAALQGALNGGE